LRRAPARKNFFGARRYRRTSALGENTDEICVFVTLHFRLRRSCALGRAFFAAVIAVAITPEAAASAPQKKLFTGGVCGRVDGSGEPQNARISADRFAAATAAPSGCGQPRRDSRE